MFVRRLLSSPAALLLVMAAGCGAGTKGATAAKDTGSDGSGDGTDSGATGGGGSDGDGGDTDSCEADTGDTGDTGPDGACQNGADLAIHADPNLAVYDKAVTCGLESLALLLSAQWDAFDVAFSACMADTSYGGNPMFAFALTPECADCYGDYVRCAAEFCIGPCATDPAAEACVTCQENAGCYDNFASCSGFPRE
jgi:hypothetical protein